MKEWHVEQGERTAPLQLPAVPSGPRFLGVPVIPSQAFIRRHSFIWVAPEDKIDDIPQESSVRWWLRIHLTEKAQHTGFTVQAKSGYGAFHPFKSLLSCEDGLVKLHSPDWHGVDKEEVEDEVEEGVRLPHGQGDLKL